MDEIICDRCGKRMNTLWHIDGMEGYGGNCACCGDDLCASRAGGWNDEGECMECRKYESKTTDDLEFELPVSVQRHEKKEMPCPDCDKQVTEAVDYEQIIYRSDSYYMGGKKSRSYQISYRGKYDNNKILLRTERCHSLRNALIEAHKLLDGVMKAAK